MPTLLPETVSQLQREFEQLSVVLQNRPRQHNWAAAPHASHCVLFPHTAPAPQYRPPEASQHRWPGPPHATHTPLFATVYGAVHATSPKHTG